MKKQLYIAILPTGDWAEVAGEDDVQIVAVTPRQLYSLSNDAHSQGTILSIDSSCLPENIDKILGLEPETVPALSGEALWFAISEVLNSWDGDLTAEDLLEAIENESECVTVCEAFEDWDGEALHKFVISLAESAQRTFLNK